MPAGVIDNGGDEPCLNLKSFLPDMPTGGRHYHDAICTGGGDDDVKCGGGGGDGGHRGGGSCFGNA